LTQQLTGKLADGTVLSPSTIRRLSCDAEILPAVFGSDGQPLDLGRGERTASQGQRVLLVARDGGCRGCGARPEFCQAHHIWHWSHGGPTDIDNLVLVCNSCHHLVHEGGHTVHKKTDGTYSIIAPNRVERRQTQTAHDAATRHTTPSTPNTPGTPPPGTGSGGPNTPGPFNTPADDHHETDTINTDRGYPPKARNQNDAVDPANLDRTPPTSRAPNQPSPNGVPQIAEHCLNQARESIAKANPKLNLFNNMT